MCFQDAPKVGELSRKLCKLKKYDVFIRSFANIFVVGICTLNERKKQKVSLWKFSHLNQVKKRKVLVYLLGLKLFHNVCTYTKGNCVVTLFCYYFTSRMEMGIIDGKRRTFSPEKWLQWLWIGKSCKSSWGNSYYCWHFNDLLDEIHNKNTFLKSN